MLTWCINSTWIAEATLHDPTQQPRTVWRGMKKKSIHIRHKVKLVIIENDDELEVQPPLKPKLITAKLLAWYQAAIQKLKPKKPAATISLQSADSEGRTDSESEDSLGKTLAKLNTTIEAPITG
ncbi:hypothetical protein BDQ17DRAFT_1339147 [Cyathus striatus]|nr:hypothetical protein BDQ17DRAFT_1339147 [Cyathus striatus]